MGSTTNVSIRMDADIKKQAEQLFEELGMNMTTAITIFVKQSLRQGGIPFDIKINTPNAETIAAMKEAAMISRDPKAKTFSTVKELLEDLNA